MLDPYLQARIDRVNTAVVLREVAEEHFGMKGKYSRDGVQVSCPFHSRDGRKDSTPSAHIYDSSNRFWCFACKESLSLVSFVSRKEGISIARAVSLLELWAKLPSLPEADLYLKVPNLRLPHSDLTPRETLKVIYRLLHQLTPYLSPLQYDKAFTAWWTLLAQKDPSKDQCRALADKLLFIRDDISLRVSHPGSDSMDSLV